MLKKHLHHCIEQLTEGFTLRKIMLIALGAAILSFGLYNIHQQSDITEGGVLGMLLLLNYWFGISPAVLTPILDGICYLLAFKYLGFQFIKISAVSTMSVSAFFKLWEIFPPVLPNLSGNPLLAAIIGGIFVGIGVGIIVRQGGSSGGDDALALVISKQTKWKLARAYMFTDFAVLGLSLTYLPVAKIAVSVVTVTLSSGIIDFVQNMKFAWPGSDVMKNQKRVTD